MSSLKWLWPTSLPRGILLASCFSERLSNISNWVWSVVYSDFCNWTGLRTWYFDWTLKVWSLCFLWLPGSAKFKCYYFSDPDIWGLIFLVPECPPSLPTHTPSLGHLIYSSDNLLLGEDLYGYNILPFVGLWHLGLCSAYFAVWPFLPILPRFLFCVFSCGKSFLLVFRSLS